MKKESFFAATAVKAAEFFEKNSREPLCLIVLCYLDKKRQYSHHQEYFSSKQIVKGSYEFGDIDEANKFLKIDSVLNWLAENGWIKKEDLTSGSQHCYRISNLGKEMIAFLKKISENE